MTQRKYGLIPDVADDRDFLFKHSTLCPKPTIIRRVINLFKGTPKKAVDLRKWLGPVKDQQYLGSCTGHAFSEYREFLIRKCYYLEPHFKELPSKNAIFSPLYIYYKEREMEGNVAGDTGAMMRTGCKVLSQYGVCLEKEDTYAPERFRVPPTPEMDSEASKFKIASYHRLQGVQEWKQALETGYPIAIGMCVYNAFEEDEIAHTGIMPIPRPGENPIGGHAVLVVGYDDARQVFVVRNSWGDNWGDGGYFYMPYEFVNPVNVYDAWILSLQTGLPDDL